ncbi:mutT/nudix family protein [Listeria grandensis FSL F6-0971]|uniref:MutT/nudix family protein n=1 Tax=Listeria grandensis FSL F6-0971 TaxID=1265819 RepID=W7BA97_9LIST|nr:NUDIX domain-containing protein [Listeria grandensis]EUJ22887.1 mutT/nudix family protein [Listeria grandensis FSL F6-0971]
MSNWHRSFGVYGIAEENGKLLMILRESDPYKQKWDLPGGKLNDDETLMDCLKRNIAEIGGKPDITANFGVYDFLVGYPFLDKRILQHITALFYMQVDFSAEKAVPLIFQTETATTLNYKWVPMELLTDKNATPAALKAVQILQSK